MKALWLLPSIDPAWRAECLAGLRAQHVLVVNNAAPNVNLGVTRPWNVGRAAALAGGFDYLILLSEAVRFGPAGGLDLEECLDGSAVVMTMCVGWHLLALSIGALGQLGPFDENLPTYGSDRDAMIRLHLAGLPSPGYNDQRIDQHAVDAVDAGVAHSLDAGLVKVHFAHMTEYLEKKWGAGTGPGEHYQHPFDDPTRDWTWWPSVDEGG